MNKSKTKFKKNEENKQNKIKTKRSKEYLKTD